MDNRYIPNKESQTLLSTLQGERSNQLATMTQLPWPISVHDPLALANRQPSHVYQEVQMFTSDGL